MIEKINITDFPKNVFIELPEEYRNMMFQLIFLRSKTSTNVKKLLKENKLNHNIFRWRGGYDHGLAQLINFESLLFLFNNAKISRDSIEKKVNVIKSEIKDTKNRILKTTELLSFIKDLRLILRGNTNISNKFKINPGTFNNYISNNKIKKLPLDLIEDLTKFTEENILCFKFTFEELQDNILSYRAHHGKTIKPEFQDERKIPIKVTPEFESIIYHLMGDGHVRAIGSGEYTQLSKKGRVNFLNKLYNVFGYFEVTEKSFDHGKVIIPKVIISIICKYYNLNFNGFNWNTSKLPLNISSDRDFKIAGLAAFIIDEGHVSNRGIEIYSGNQQLLSQIRKLAVDLDLDCSELKTKKANGNTKESFRFRIRKESSREFLRMVIKLKEKYQYCGLAQKESILQN